MNYIKILALLLVASNLYGVEFRSEADWSIPYKAIFGKSGNIIEKGIAPDAQARLGNGLASIKLALQATAYKDAFASLSSAMLQIISKVNQLNATYKKNIANVVNESARNDKWKKEIAQKSEGLLAPAMNDVQKALMAISKAKSSDKAVSDFIQKMADDTNDAAARVLNDASRLHQGPVLPPRG